MNRPSSAAHGTLDSRASSVGNIERARPSLGDGDSQRAAQAAASASRGSPVLAPSDADPGRRMTCAQLLHLARDLREQRLVARALRRRASIHSASFTITSFPIPRDVTAGVPMRTPEGSKGLRGSNGTAL